MPHNAIGSLKTLFIEINPTARIVKPRPALQKAA